MGFPVWLGRVRALLIHRRELVRVRRRSRRAACHESPCSELASGHCSSLAGGRWRSVAEGRGGGEAGYARGAAKRHVGHNDGQDPGRQALVDDGAPQTWQAAELETDIFMHESGHSMGVRWIL